ncbi:hypothetical protein [Spirosoma foliorum]|uniref:Uncharacterized protein n=1 Tax=Spirosoma foliorum TaxID=2710596 RepID=A0A7G5H0E7_9BACT|nr:hypothetical protein [Spirosoma foliorum]QMW04589.1 hypothetical protein H3H32_06545 [Spirosoma foliorum]
MSSSRNLYFFFIAPLLALLLASCSSELIIQKDPAAPTAGDYKLTGVASYTINGVVSSAPVSGTLSVFVGENPQTYYFLEKVGTSQLGYLTTCVGEKFTVESIVDGTKYNNTWYYGRQNGSGTISAGRIEFDRYANTSSVSLISPNTGERISFTMPIQKHIHVIAIK